MLQVHGGAQPLADGRRGPPEGAVAHRLVPGLQVVQSARQQEGQRGADDHLVELVRALQLVGEPGHLGLVQHRAVAASHHARGTGVDHHEPGGAEVPGVRPAVGVRLLVHAGGEVVEQVGDIRVRLGPLTGHDLAPDLVPGAFGHRQVPQVLVHPVGAQGRHDPLVPPVGGLHLLAPGRGGVPVVADVVVVEDHQRRQGGQQPLHPRLGPRQPVEVGVLLVVGQLLPGPLVQGAAGGDELLHRLAGGVGVHLVAEQQHQLRQVGGAGLAGGVGDAEGAQGVHAVGGVAVGVVRHGGAAGAEAQVHRGAGGEGADVGSGPHVVGLGPHDLPVQQHLVGAVDPRAKPGELHQGVVVSVGGEGVGLGVRGVGGLAVAGPLGAGRGVGPRQAHADPRGAVGLDPDGGGLVVHVAQQRPDGDRRRHARSVPARAGCADRLLAQGPAWGPTTRGSHGEHLDEPRYAGCSRPRRVHRAGAG